jgi:glycosidase
MDRRRALLATVVGVAVLVVVVFMFQNRPPAPQATISSVPATPAASGPPATVAPGTTLATPTQSVPPATPAPTASAVAVHAHDGAIDRDGLRHDSRDLLYRTPGGAQPAGTPVSLRFRTFHSDVTGVTARVYSVDSGATQLLAMKLAAEDVSCYEADLADETCDFWQVTLADSVPDNVWYRFMVEDGDATVYYADDTPALDGGLGAPSDVVIDQSWALTVYEPDFTVPSWASTAVFYQIFPDRFRNGNPANDPQTGDVRYDDPVLALPWGTLPEGYCRGYDDARDNCPWRFDDAPPASSPRVEVPRGRDYFGGDLAGITQELDYIASLGVTAIYLNPIFDSASNHGYDTQDYTRIDPYFGTQKDWDNLVRQASARGIRIVLDGVFNHLSSDSPFFDRYGHYPDDGACESLASPFRDWFYFRTQTGGPCVGPDGPGTMGYSGWAGVDSIPVIHKDLAAVVDYFLTGADAIATRWLADGASGWRLDVSGDPTFPDGWWQAFRGVVKAQDPDALTVAEQWQKDTTLLRLLRGDQLDTTMNYRFRDAVLGLLAPDLFDRKGFPASGAPTSPAYFANRMLSQQEDYAPATYGSLLNLLDSHDTERVLWTLTPGAQTTADREQNAANLAEGVRRMELASLIQFTVPGAPMVYYGDEVGMTGDDDPDDRRTYPWPDLGGTTDQELLGHYEALSGLRSADEALAAGDLRFLLVGSDAEGTVAYGRRTEARAAIVALNRSAQTRTLEIPVGGFVPDGTELTPGYSVGPVASGSVAAVDGMVTVELPPLSGVLLETATIDLAPPAAPAGLAATAGAGTMTLTWDAPAGAAGYDVYASPLSGGGFVRLNDAPLGDASYAVLEAPAGTRFFVVTALDEVGNESGWSNEVAAPGAA